MMQFHMGFTREKSKTCARHDINVFGAHLGVSFPSSRVEILKNTALYVRGLRQRYEHRGRKFRVFLVRSRLGAMNFLRRECTPSLKSAKTERVRYRLGLPSSECIYMRATMLRKISRTLALCDVLFHFPHLSYAIWAKRNIKSARNIKDKIVTSRCSICTLYESNIISTNFVFEMIILFVIMLYLSGIWWVYRNISTQQ